VYNDALVLRRVPTYRLPLSYGTVSPHTVCPCLTVPCPHIPFALALRYRVPTYRLPLSYGTVSPHTVCPFIKPQARKSSPVTFLIMKLTRCTNFSNLFWNETLHVSDSSSVHHQKLFAVHSAVVYVIQSAFEQQQDQDGTAVQS
jgi:hypothetical protein